MVKEFLIRLANSYKKNNFANQVHLRKSNKRCEKEASNPVLYDLLTIPVNVTPEQIDKLDQNRFTVNITVLMFFRIYHVRLLPTLLHPQAPESMPDHHAAFAAPVDLNPLRREHAWN